ncbi:MAG TPA: substrate-binding domain-containing protein [Streptosporangiaceae bacterium]|nr:substrate-binding domain-containing protein [Streptosporangiaceae bacterium]
MTHFPAKLGALLTIASFGIAAAGCSSPATGASSDTKHSGTASVAYASSLQFLNEKIVSPAFTTAEGYAFSGRGASSGELSSEIAARVITPNVFEAVGGDNITPLEPKFTRWYVQYAGTSMVVAYNPRSKYASRFQAIASGKEPLKDLFTLMETPGFKLGRTDPNIDPQGRDFVYMLELAQSYYHLPANTVTKILGGPLASARSSEIYAESALDATLQSGQLDAASAFITQAAELHLSYIPLPTAINLGSFADAAQYKKASITITGNQTKHGSPQVIDITLTGKPTAAGIAFVRYTLSQAGLAEYRQGGFTVLTPTVSGDKSAIPRAIASELP